MSKQVQNQLPSFSVQELGNFDLLVDGIFKVLSDHLGFVQPCLAVLSKDKKVIHFVKNNSHPFVNSFLKKIIGLDISRIVIPTTNSHNLFVKCFFDQKIYTTKKIEDLARPVVSSEVTKAVDKIVGLKNIILVPLVFNGETIGVLGFGSKKEEFLSEDKKQLLLSLGEKMAKYLSRFQPFLTSNSGSKHTENLLNIDQNFLEDMSLMMQELASNDGLSEQKIATIRQKLLYLNSLILLHKTVKKDDK